MPIISLSILLNIQTIRTRKDFQKFQGFRQVTEIHVYNYPLHLFRQNIGTQPTDVSIGGVHSLVLYWTN